MTPDEWLADFEAKTAELQRNAAAFRRNLETAGTSVSSEDGTMTVTVASNGALLDLKISDSAPPAKGSELAAEVMALVRKAREGAATQVVEAFGPLAGRYADKLDTDVSVPEAPTPTTKARKVVNDDEDFDSRSVYR